MPAKDIKPEVLNIASNRPMLPTPTILSTCLRDPDLLVLLYVGGKARGYLKLFHSSRPNINPRNEP